MKANTFYFSHDFTARSDEKIKTLLMKYGMQGYGIYWSIIEDLYQNNNKLKLNENTAELIAYDLRVDTKIIYSIINDFGLFNLDYCNGVFSSDSIERRLKQRIEKSEKAKNKAFKRWGKKEDNNDAEALKNDAIAMQQHNVSIENDMLKQCKDDAGAMQLKESKGKERKEKENKVNEIKENKIKKNQVKKSDLTSNPAAQGEYVGQEFNLRHETSDMANDNGVNSTNIPTEQISFVKTQENREGDFRKKFIEIYDTWMKSRNMPVRIDAGDASAVKKVIAYIQKLDSVQNGIKQPAEVWQFIFDQWENLTTWQQTQTQLKQINSQLPNFIETLKQAHNGKQKHSKNSNELQSLASALRNSIAGSQSLQ